MSMKVTYSNFDTDISEVSIVFDTDKTKIIKQLTETDATDPSNPIVNKFVTIEIFDNTDTLLSKQKMTKSELSQYISVLNKLINKL
ncbi:hypothetical protein D7X33_21000 [Butyricicoccus sp. 1XD8-22]|nr:hypothetical protein D7X33_21000 [Butyricicoccus sp. 1XD8-22]